METKHMFTPWPSLASNGKQISQKEGTVFYYDFSPKGNVKQTLVFIHGLGDEADTWRYLLPLLSEKGYRCIALDLPGFGRSVWKGKISVSRHADTVIQVMNDCGITNPAVLIGSSMGGGIAELVAIKRPGLVQSLILMCGCFPIKYGISLGLLIFGLVGRSWYRGFRKNHEGAWKSLYPYYYDLDAMSDEDKTFLRERVIARVESDNQERGYFASLRSISSSFIFARSSLTRKIKKFNGKILLIWGENDRVMPIEKAAPFRKLRPDAVVKTMTNVGHHPQSENPAETVDIIVDFLG
jgi:pimeloyl-ACP methyl ester carboxylesterase